MGMDSKIFSIIESFCYFDFSSSHSFT